MKKLKSLAIILLSFICVFAFAGCGNTNNQTPNNNSNTENIFLDNNKVLVAYFSATNNTEGIATKIQSELNSDLYEILAKVPYTSADLNYNTDCRANREQNDASSRPEIGSETIEDFEKYDYIFLGYPIWWNDAPKIIYTFLESYDFSGKTIIPFCTSGGSGIENSVTNLRSLASSATWKNGKRFSSNASKEDVKSWIDGLGIQFTSQEDN